MIKKQETSMTRREFMMGAVTAGVAGCTSLGVTSANENKILFGACLGFEKAPLMKSIGYDFIERNVATSFDPEKDDEWWKKQREMIMSLKLPLRSCNGFLPGKFRLTGNNADHEPALRYAEKALRRAEEVGVKTIVFGSGGARNVPGDFLDAKAKPDLERGVAQYTDFCRELCRRTSDLKKVKVVIEPLRPNESNIINYVWQGLQICEEVNSPRLMQLADIFHMMMGRESAQSIVLAGKWLKHCHIATYGTRQFPGSDPKLVKNFVPYFEALKAIGYTGGVSCECGWGKKEDLAKNLETALKTMKGLI